MKTIDISHELTRFHQHLENNRQTILSAKFGDGKTYFLNEYIKQHEEDTFFVVLHPVNYVVSSNEDIFEYIKRDILCSLVHSDEFKEVDWNQLLNDFFNYDTILQGVDKIASYVKYGYLFTMPLHLFKKVDDKYAVDKYFDRFKDTKGGLFEFDQFSFAIERTIKKIQENNKKCVLIIEDLDRLDPAHLFRILNVLSAHVDIGDGLPKFSFDNIVAVLDYDTTKHIFNHFYGERANYDGYMSKFISSHAFEYSITRVAHEELIKYLEEKCWVSFLSEVPPCINKISFPNFIASLSVRDVVHILDGIENQIEPTDVEIYKDCKIKSNDYITRFLSILVRMKYKITFESLLDYFVDDYNWFKMLNNYVLFARNSAGRVFSINSDNFTFHITKTDFICSITWHNPAFGSNSTVSVKDIAEKALDAAISRVKDGEQIIVDTIPLGELYLE
jgi:hypothetical protein